MPRGRLLVADRNPEFLSKTSSILRAAGYEMIAAADGRKVLELVAAKQVDAVIAHFALDGLDGTDVCRELRRRDESVPCYLMIPHDDDELAEQCLEAGARNVLVRPLKRTELIFAARSAMNLRSLLRVARGATQSGLPRKAPPPPPGAPADERASFFQFELFKRLLAIELKRAKRYDFPLALVLISPDGESVLPLTGGPGPVDGIDAEAGTLVGRAVQSAIRDIDIPMHFADDTIMVVMPHTDLDGAKVVAERIRRKARASEGAITVSIGLTAMAGSQKPTYSQLVARASRALRQARKDGGDRVAIG
jgi:PleD family two-component response regulator